MKSLTQHITESLRTVDEAKVLNYTKVKSGQRGEDYHGNKGKVISIYKDFAEYKKKSNRANMHELQSWIDDKLMDADDPIVIVQMDDDSEHVAFSYGDEGFSVYR